MMRQAVALLALARGSRSTSILGTSSLRVRTWWRLLREYGAMRAVFAAHEAEDFFVYGTPPQRYSDLGAHVAFKQLEALRAVRSDGSAFSSTVAFVEDFPVLPTYLPIVLGASRLNTLKSSPVVTSDSPRPLDSAVWAARRPGHVSNRRATLTDRRNHG